MFLLAQVIFLEHLSWGNTYVKPHEGVYLRKTFAESFSWREISEIEIQLFNINFVLKYLTSCTILNFYGVKVPFIYFSKIYNGSLKILYIFIGFSQSKVIIIKNLNIAQIYLSIHFKTSLLYYLTKCIFSSVH